MPKKIAPRKNLLDETARVLVTGGAGFIGSALIHQLNQRGVEKIVVTDLLGTDEKWKNLVPLKFEDYLEASAFSERLEHKPDSLGRFNAIFHLGACSSTLEKNASYLMENNFGFTRQLCRWALDNRARFVYASSAATYGDGTRGMDDKDPAIDQLRPLNIYGYSKQIFDLHARQMGYFEEIVGLKYFNVFGPNEYHKADMRSLVCKAYDQIRETGRLKLFKSYKPEYPDGGQMRDFIYVRDAVEMTLHLAETEEAAGLYNIGGGVARTWLDLANALFKALGQTPNIEFIDMPDSIRNQYQYYTCADISKVRGTGYQAPITSLEDSIHDYAVNYLIPGRRLGE